MSVRRPHTEYRIGYLWTSVIALLFLTIGGWYVGSRRPVMRVDLAIFVAWLFAVPVAAIWLRRLVE